MADTNETALEKTFADLANSRLRDKSQTLMQYLVGFQMLKQEEEGQRAVGVFGFEIDKKFYYSPAFFLNGEIHGLDSLYSVDSDLFVPLTEEWVNTLVNRKQVELGKVDQSSKEERGVKQPNYTRMKIIPGGGGNISLKLGSMLSMDRQDTVLTLPEGLRLANATGWFKQALETNPRLLENFNKFHNYADLYEPLEIKKAAEEKVTIIESHTAPGVEQLDESQKQALIDGGIAVIDKREEVDKALTFKTDGKQVFTNPTDGGLYEVLWNDGYLRDSIIAKYPGQEGCVFVYDIEEDRACFTSPSNILARVQYDADKFKAWLDKEASAADEASADDVGVFISAAGVTAGCYTIIDKTLGLDGLVVYNVRHNGSYVSNPDKEWVSRPSAGSSGQNYGDAFHNAYMTRTRQPEAAERVAQIIVRETGGKSPSFCDLQLILNTKHWYFIKLRDSTRYERDEYANPGTNSKDEKKLKDSRICYKDFGTFATLDSVFNKVASEISVWSNDHLITLKDAEGTQALTKNAAVKYLILKHACTYEDALGVINSADRVLNSWKVLKKTAANVPDWPNIDDSAVGNELTDLHKSQIPYTTASKAISPDNRDYYRYSSPFENPQSEDTFGTVNNAAQTGQKEVFDASVLSSLIKTQSPTDLVDKFLPTITAAMDRLGRLLFLIFWHYEKFDERYGEQDLSEFIDNLKSTFERLGEVIIFAKRRTMSGDPAYYGMGVSPQMEDVSNE